YVRMNWTNDHVEVLAALVFTIAGAVHLVRAAAGWEMQLGPHAVPMWGSWLAVVIAGYLAVHFWRRMVNR
ncbi:MAG: hypothetical protein SVW02_04015, partial [Candidatus Nanohaloarchaea archaeon]|nr:hypothetical protein [Candidatus Nanohaloarchaea archaeon]